MATSVDTQNLLKKPSTPFLAWNPSDPLDIAETYWLGNECQGSSTLSLKGVGFKK